MGIVEANNVTFVIYPDRDVGFYRNYMGFESQLTKRPSNTPSARVDHICGIFLNMARIFYNPIDAVWQPYPGC